MGPNVKRKRDGKTILIVEDNAAIRTMMAAAFLADGFKICAEAENGKEGLAAAERTRPDAITLDLTMPLMNGLEAAVELRKLFPKTPIIPFTLYSHTALESEAARVGINLVLSKSIALTTLVEKTHELMGD